jgi:hypothetical protein
MISDSTTLGELKRLCSDREIVVVQVTLWPQCVVAELRTGPESGRAFGDTIADAINNALAKLAPKGSMP